MYAVIRTGGKQYKVAENDVIRVEKLSGAAGEAVELGEVLMLGNGAEAEVGAPLVDGARVVATILDQARGPKIVVFKKKRRKNYRRTRGHRQDVTVLRITDILSAGAKPKAKPVQAEETPKTAAKAPAKAKPAKAAPKKPAKAKAAPKKAEKAPAKAKTAAKKPAQAKKTATAKDAAKGKAKSAKASTSAKKSGTSKSPARKGKGGSKEKS